MLFNKNMFFNIMTWLKLTSEAPLYLLLETVHHRQCLLSYMGKSVMCLRSESPESKSAPFYPGETGPAVSVVVF